MYQDTRGIVLAQCRTDRTRVPLHGRPRNPIMTAGTTAHVPRRQKSLVCSRRGVRGPAKTPLCGPNLRTGSAIAQGSPGTRCPWRSRVRQGR